MKIVKQDQLIKNDGYSYYRREYTDNSFEWLSFDKQDVLFTIKDDDDFADFDVEELEKMYQKLINKPSTTTNEQLKLPTDLKDKMIEMMSKHIDLRNSDGIVDRNLYHAFLDWEMEMRKLIV